ncbi:MAG TPA: ribonuclease HII [Candidatus Acidoferrales bacterium]|nr:ribonuclease HII [Candidatus Acidoferrales bacterium]
MLTKRERRQAARMGVLLKVERELWAAGMIHVAGCDEVGVGPLAGPVVAAAVILPRSTHIRGVDDSKKLPAQRREELAARIHAEATAVGVGIVGVDEIDRLNIYRAALEAMRRAVVALPLAPEHIVVDARTIPQIDIPQTPIVGGDGRCYSVAAASIVAKVARDAMMVELDARYPVYGFAQNMGYGTAAHLSAIDRHGPSPVHRNSFAPVRQLRMVF